jgi:hypothetical protein
MDEMNSADCLPNTMLVCRNGHVISDLLDAFPDQAASHCDRCGATTLDRCPTCGQILAGSIAVPGLVPAGRLQAPHYCSRCGARFPWAERFNPSSGPEALATLERLLRRLPRVARQLRYRHGNRPPFRIDDERDLEDLVRSLLALHFDDIRPQARTPRYSLGTRTDFWLGPDGTALTPKLATREIRPPQLRAQLQEDILFYQRERSCRSLVCYVHDPEQLLTDRQQLEAAWSGPEDDLDVRCVIAS